MAAKKNSEKEKTHSTKAGLMSKHADEVDEMDVDAEERANKSDENETIDDKLPRTSKHSTGKSGGHEGLH